MEPLAHVKAIYENALKVQVLYKWEVMFSEQAVREPSPETSEDLLKAQT